MTYVEKKQFGGRYVAASAHGDERGGAMSTVLAIVTWPLRSWRNNRDLEEIKRMSREELRDIGLTPADVVAARYAPFHVGASIMLAHLAEQNRRGADPATGREDSRDIRDAAPAKQEHGQ